jgi:group I intron endonuclease
METSSFNLSASNVTITEIVPQEYYDSLSNSEPLVLSGLSAVTVSGWDATYLNPSSLSGDQRLNYIIYRTTCKVNKKIYVGQHYVLSGKFHYYLGSGTLFRRAINKYGRENFYRETLEYCTSAAKGDRETYWVIKLNSMNTNIGYNLTTGGEGTIGYKHTPETLKKMSDAKKGKPSSNKGIIRSKETLQKLSNSHKSQIPWNKGIPLTEEHIRKNRESHLGKHQSEKTIIKRRKFITKYIYTLNNLEDYFIFFNQKQRRNICGYFTQRKSNTISYLGITITRTLIETPIKR